MRVPVSWLRDYVDLPDGTTGREIAEKLVAVGLEVETVEEVGSDITGPLVVGEVTDIEELTGFKKPIRYCRVDVGLANGTGERQGIVCGATNFQVGQRVVVALPGAVLPGGFAISARKTYGRTSEGMICSAAELGIGEDHSGIMVLPTGSADPGDDAFDVLGLRDEVLDIAVTPDRGYALSMRGVAREVATGYRLAFTDPARVETPAEGDVKECYPASVADADICSRYVLRGVSGFDPASPTPLWMRRRLEMAGQRSISLAVDVTNYVMLELGQPLHAWNRAKLRGPIEVRLARPGERLETLDRVVRELDPDDILITDASGPINIAGVMGGRSTEIDETSTDILIEAACFAPTHIARTSRRHQLASESSRRFERGVDSAVQLAAATRAVTLLAELGGATVDAGVTHVDQSRPRSPITIPVEHAARVAGVDYPDGTSAYWLGHVGCTVVERGETLEVTPPTWRPDLTDPNDLAEEVIRYEGYENIPAVAPRAPSGGGLTVSQRLRRSVGRALAGAGLVEVLSYPFVGERDFDALLVPREDARRRTLRLSNPLNEDEPFLRTTLLPGLLRALARNVGRGFKDVALFEMGLVYLPDPDSSGVAPMLRVDRGPTAEELAAVNAALPDQPRRVGAVLAGNREPAGWWGPGRPATWADAIAIAREVAYVAGVELDARAVSHEPWHPGRCAELRVAGSTEDLLVGHAGELHPRVVEAYGLPARTVAMEVDLDRIEARRGGISAPEISTYPVATQDVALIVDETVPAAAVEEALRSGAGELLENVRLFDVYTGEQVGAGRKSLAYTLRFRASDRTLAPEEIARARDGAVTAASERVGAVLRG